MTPEGPRVLAAEQRRRGKEPLPPSDLRGLAPWLIVGGLVLSVAGWTDVALFYIPLRFGSPEWEFGIIARTFDSMPLPTLGLLLLVLGLRARGGSAMWTRGMAVALAVIALLCLAALGFFALDLPLAVRAAQRAGAGAQAGALLAAGLKRAMAKAILFGLCYLAAYTWMAMMLWRVRGKAGQPT